MNRKPPNYWTKEKCHEEALKHSTKISFKTASAGAYQHARRNKILDKICNHMTSPHKPHGYWTKEKCKKLALNYNSRTEFVNKHSGAYDFILRNNLLNEVFSHIKRKPSNYWTKIRCQKEALKYKSKVEFKNKSTSSFQASRKNGWLEDICSHMSNLHIKKERLIYSYEFHDNYVYVGLTCDPTTRKNKHFSKSKRNKSVVHKHFVEKCEKYTYKELTCFLTEDKAKIMEKKCLEDYVSKGWGILNISKTGSLGGSLIKWTKEKSFKEAKKYKRKCDFRKASGGAFNALYQNNWLNEACSHMPR